jgi:prepilin-type N-terminal cleavage/methylation domain-containing protein
VRAEREDQRSRDAGFTLIEMTVSLVIMGTLMAALALAVSVTLRAAPTASDRIDDSRTTRGLSTWLAQDTTSTPNIPAGPAGGMDTSPTSGANDCKGEGQNIVHMSWTETFASTDTYVANYRFVGDGITARVARYTCSRQGADGDFTTSRAQFLTPLLDAAAPPVGDFDETANVLSFTLTGQTGETVLIETSSRNPSDFFP